MGFLNQSVAQIRELFLSMTPAARITAALLLGVMFHGGFSFIPGIPPGLWFMVDNSPSTTISVMSFVTHIFRMTLFFFIAGFFARMMLVRKGTRGFWRDRAKRILLPLVAGWMIFFPMIAAVWMWGLTKMFAGKMPPAPADMPAPPPGAFPLTHLWFLYILLILYAIVDKNLSAKSTRYTANDRRQV